MAKLQTSLLAFLTAILLVVGCSKTAEGETKSWKANTDKVEALMAEYPGMKPALEQRLEAAKETWAEAEGMSGDAQVEKMAAANSELMGGFVGQLKGLDRKLKKLRESKVDAAAQAGDSSSRLAAKVAADDAQSTIERVERMLKEGAEDEAAATALMSKISADLKTAQSAVDRVTKADKNKRKAKAKDAKAKDAKVKADKDAAEAKKADWTCQYCDKKNKHDARECSGCGAARPGK